MPYKDPAEKKFKAAAYYIANRKEIRKQQNKHNNTPERRRNAVLRAQQYHERVKGTAHHRYIQLKSQAKQRKIIINITLEQYAELVFHNRCAYCEGVLPICGHGLARIDNRNGYTVNNVTPCCALCNVQKGNLEKIGFRFPRTVELLEELIRDTRRSDRSVAQLQVA